MNIFFLCLATRLCARWHVDKHVVKMILETAQLLSAAHWILDELKARIWGGENGSNKIYRKTHANHPSAKWARAHLNNYRWLASLGIALCAEYTERYGRIHKSQAVIEFLQRHEPRHIPSFEIESTPGNPASFSLPVPQAMFDVYKQDEVLLKCNNCHGSFRVAERPLSCVGLVHWQPSLHQFMSAEFKTIVMQLLLIRNRTFTGFSSLPLDIFYLIVDFIFQDSLKIKNGEETSLLEWTCVDCNEFNQTLLFNNVANLITAYRRYYACAEKSHFSVWKHNKRPWWFPKPANPVMQNTEMQNT